MVVDSPSIEQKATVPHAVAKGVGETRLSDAERLEKQFANPDLEIELKRAALEQQLAVEQQQARKPERLRDKNTLLEHNPYVNESARLFTNPFADLDMALDEGKPLYKSFLGRVEINLLARGVCAAIGFTAMSYAVKEWKIGAGVENQEWFAKPLELIADGIDKVIGKPLTSVIAAIPGVSADQAKQWMTFNEYVAKSHVVDEALREGARVFENREVFGMSLGQAVVDVTAAFAAGSTGAAIGRNIANFLDPNYKTSWIHHGKVDVGEMLQATAKETFRIITYNQGEDWAAAIPYLIQRKIGSGIMSATGFSNMWELQNNYGNTPMVHEDGTLGRSHELAGAFDLQTRFMGYNWYTLMYRDAYNHIGHKFGEWKDNGFALDISLPENPLQGIGKSLDEAAKYIAKSFIKSQIYMAPAVLAFWPQNMGINKYNHALMDAQSGEFITTSPTYSFNPTSLEQMQQPFFDKGKTPAHAGIAARINAINPDQTYYAGETVRDISGLQGRDPYDHHGSAISPMQNTIGRLCHGYADNIIHPLFEKLHIGGNASDTRWLSDTFARAQLAYTPYMIAKYELAQLWDTPEMDAAIYRGLDGLTAGKPSEIWEGVKDVGSVIALQPVSEETHALVGEARGLINSTAESKQKTALSQERLKRQEAIENYADAVSPAVRPLNQIAEAQLSGKTKNVPPDVSPQLLALTF